MAIPAGFVQYAADSASFAVRIPAGVVSQPIFSGGGITFWVHTDPGGPRDTNLYTVSGAAAAAIVSDQAGRVPFYAAPGLGTLWLQPLTPAGDASGIFYPCSPATLADDVETLKTQINQLLGR